ncbi:MAG: hypothetical protein Q8M15_03095 [Bacteroidota bacterium]|nr:hypothetical protein [Bacteroidota bacterium]
MTPFKNSIFLILCLIIQLNVMAQVDSLKNYNIDVVRIFKPILSEAIKIPINPNPEKPEIKKTIYTYLIPEQQFQVQPTLYTIKPISLGTALLPKLKNNYSRVGFGNLTSPLFEFYLNTVRNKNTQAGMFIKHLSAGGDEAYKKFSNNTVYGYVKQFINKGSLGIDAYYHRNRVHLYGSPNDKIILPADPKLTYVLYDTKLNYLNFNKDSSGLSYMLDMGYYNYSSDNKYIENNFFTKARINKHINNIPFELITGLQINNTRYTGAPLANQATYQRIYFDLNPEIKLSDENFYLKGGFNSTLTNDSTGSKLYFFPNAEAGYALMVKKLTVFAGFTGNLKPNTFRSITSENPFAARFELNNTVNKFEIYGGFKGEIGPMTHFILMGSSATVQNLLFYTHDSSKANQITTFDPGSSKLTVFTGSINHAYNEKLRLGISTNIYGYKLYSLDHPYSRPEFEAKVNATYNFGDKFLLKFDLFYMSERWGGYNQSDNSIFNLKISPFVDANFGVDYRYSKTVSAFLHLNNIANNRYQRFYAYPVYGFNFMGGFTFTF